MKRAPKRVYRSPKERRRAILETRKRTSAFSDLDIQKLVEESLEAYMFQLKSEVPVSRFAEEVIEQSHSGDGFWKLRKLLKSLNDDSPVIRLQNMASHIFKCPECSKILRSAKEFLQEVLTPARR